MQILVVDDDQAVRDSLARSLKYSGDEVTTAADGVEALAQLAGHTPDAVIMDVMMPASTAWRPPACCDSRATTFPF